MAITTRARERSPMRTLEALLEEFPGIGLPVLNVGTVFLVDGSVAVSGSMSPEVAATAKLTINGHRVPVTELGTFCTVVRPEGQRGLRLALETESGLDGRSVQSVELSDVRPRATTQGVPR